MRTFFTSFWAFWLSLFAGSFAAQWLAVSTNAGQEYILVFFWTAAISIPVAIAFFVAQLRPDPLGAVGKVAAWLAIIMIIALVGLLGWSYVEAKGDMAKLTRDLPIIAGLSLPGLAILLVQWLFTRWRLRRTPPQFGRAAS